MKLINFEQVLGNVAIRSLSTRVLNSLFWQTDNSTILEDFDCHCIRKRRHFVNSFFPRNKAFPRTVREILVMHLYFINFLCECFQIKGMYQHLCYSAFVSQLRIFSIVLCFSKRNSVCFYGDRAPWLYHSSHHVPMGTVLPITNPVLS